MTGELFVRFSNNHLYPVQPSMMSKANFPLYEVGDVVRMIEDMNKVRQLQEGHRGWKDDMALVRSCAARSESSGATAELRDSFHIDG